MAFYKKKVLTAEKIIAVFEEFRSEKAIDEVIISPELDELTDEKEIEDGRMIINDGVDELPVDVVGTVEIHATIDDKTVPETTQSSSEKTKHKKKKPYIQNGCFHLH
ncbi:hypothetical protein GWI33_008760 [Rhynchophorus ferrugineus]|uniref:Uncharacterized protein n=1 Tax=Rhynchophorus ferrugineus TaxID=354439 RepID=A0A834MH36_RHYFE|nr:hypothetical protein GWI33_008760 [Rhynchophorus ferrugineus]